MNADDEKKLREDFEKWVSSPPFEHSTERHTELSACPGIYRFVAVDLAWCAWQDAYALGRRAGMTEAAGICAGYFPKAHTMASENADRYAIQDETARLCADAIEKARDS